MFIRRGVLMEGETGGTGTAGGTGTGQGTGQAGGNAAGTGAGQGTGPASAAFDWSAHVSDEATRGWVTAKGFKDPSALALSALNQEKLLGVPAEQIIKLPKDLAAAKPEELNAIYDRLGRPSKPEEYQLPVPEGDKGEFAAEASKWFHELGINGKQGRDLAAKWNAHVAGMTKAQAEATAARDAAQVKELTAAWGPHMEANTAIVDAAAKSFGMTAEQLTALKATMGPAAAMKFMHSIGSKLGVEGSFVVGDGKGAPGSGKSPEAAKAEIATLRADKLWVARFAKGDAEVRKQMAELHKLAYPGDAVLE